MKRPAASQQLSFQSRLESISNEMEYYALPVPAEITRALGTHGPVPVTAQVNESKPFLVSLFPTGGGQHYIRVKSVIRKATKIKGGDRVQVKITVIDRSAEILLPADVAKVLKAEGALESFKALPPGKQRYTLRWIDEAAKPETRAKRILTVVQNARG